MRTSAQESETPRKRLKGGFELSTFEMFEIFLALFLIVGVAIFFIAGGDMLSGILNQLCTSVPVMCGQNANPQDIQTSQESFNALVIAHNCILDPANCPCTKNAQDCIFEPTKKSQGAIFSGNGISGFAINFAAASSNQIKVECGYLSQDTTLASYTVGYYGDAQKAQAACQAECAKKCTAIGQGCLNPRCESAIDQNLATSGATIIGSYDCIAKVKENVQNPNIPKSCTVTNFNTPDNFNGISGSAKEYISGFGDPNFLIYFQKFPQGEDQSWKSMSSWYDGIGTFMFVSMCFGSLAKPVWKLVNLVRPTKFAQAVKAIPSLGTEIGKEASYVKSVFARSKVDVTKFKLREIDPGSQWFEKVLVIPGERPVNPYTVSEFSTDAFAKALKDDSKDWFTNNYKEAAARFAGYVGADAALSYGAARFDSEIGKFVYDNPGSLVIGMPLKTQQPTKLAKIDYDNPGGAISKLGKPIILDKGSNGVVSLALASPCHADLTVKDSKISCGFYSYNKLTNDVQCLDPKIITQPDDKDLKCGDFSGFKQGSGILGRDYWLPDNYFYAVQGMVSDKTISSSSGSTLKTLRLPSSGSASLLNIERAPCSGVSDSLVCYRADLSDSGQTQSTLGIQIVCGSSYSDILAGTGNANRAKFVNILEGRFKNYANPDYSQFCIVYNTLLSDQDKAYENYKKSSGIVEIVWVKDKLYGDEWKLVDGYKTGKGDVYYDNGKGDVYYPQIYETAVFSSEAGRSSLAFFKDGGRDGKWDQFALFIGQIIDNRLPDNAKAFIFDDQDFNGEIDAISYWNCWVDGVVTSVNAAAYKDKPNFCYRKSSPFTGVAITTMSFAMDALAKRSPHPAVWLAGAAANCGLAYVQIAGEPNWPGGGVG